jgi:plastocyanin
MLVTAAALTLTLPAFAAQEADAPHPAHIHSGTCAELGDVVAPLMDVAFSSTDVAKSGPDSAIPVKFSETVVDMPLQEIIDGGHAINVHKNADEIDAYIACGDIGGAVTTDENGRSELRIGLGALNGSGHTGVAWLGADGDSTQVTVMLIEPGTMASEGAAAAQEPATAAANTSAESLAVEIKGFAYNPPTIEVPVGGSVTWTNQDSAPHTATAPDHEILQSGAIAFGESYTQTFDTAGTYDYHCEFHPNMHGEIVVQ